MDRTTVFPELFLWHTFRGILHALDVLHNGRCDATSSGQPDTTNRPHAIYHMDLKNGNVFLDDADIGDTLTF